MQAEQQSAGNRLVLKGSRTAFHGCIAEGMIAIEYAQQAAFARHAGNEVPFVPAGVQLINLSLVITTFNNDYEPVRPYCINHCLPVKAFTYSNSFISQLPLLLSNLGIALLPSYLGPYLPPNLRFEDVLAEPLYLDFTVLYNSDSNNAALHSFIECCKSVYVLERSGQMDPSMKSQTEHG